VSKRSYSTFCLLLLVKPPNSHSPGDKWEQEAEMQTDPVKEKKKKPPPRRFTLQ